VHDGQYWYSENGSGDCNYICGTRI